MLGEHHAGYPGVYQFLDNHGHPVVLRLDVAVGAIGADLGLEGSDPALLDLLKHFTGARSAEECPELPGTAGLGRILDCGARPDCDCDLGTALLAQSGVAAPD